MPAVTKTVSASIDVVLDLFRWPLQPHSRLRLLDGEVLRSPAGHYLYAGKRAECLQDRPPQTDACQQIRALGPDRSAIASSALICSSRSWRSQLLKPARTILKIVRLQRASRLRQLTVLSIIGINPAAAFNRTWRREGILSALAFRSCSSSTRGLSF
jgi:hypothetical protein